MFEGIAYTLVVLFMVSTFLIFKLKMIISKTTFYDRIFMSVMNGVLIFFTLLGIKTHVDRESISPGQVYHYSNIDIKNPFEPEYEKYYRVLDVVDGYVLYVDSTKKDTMSCSDVAFLLNVERIK